MAEQPPRASIQDSTQRAQLAAALTGFGRALRAAGLPVGPDRVLNAYRALSRLSIAEPEDFFWTLRALFVSAREQLAVFDLVFMAFWGTRTTAPAEMALSESTGGATRETPSETLGAAGERHRALAAAARPVAPTETAGLSASALERLRQLDFEVMNDDELAAAKSLVASIALPRLVVPTRRFEPYPRGPRIDPRASLRSGLRQGGDVIPLVRRRRRTRAPTLVVIADISGSMARYSTLLLHFIHALGSDRRRLAAFVFGTRLTNITHQIRHRNVDTALAEVAKVVQDFNGGTRIGRSLWDFNRLWSRRLLGQGAIVLFISDGLDRDAGVGLAEEMARLKRSCRHLIWLNPLLRYERFEPRSLGMRAIIGHVDELRSVHNLASIDALSAALGRLGGRPESPVPARWLQ